MLYIRFWINFNFELTVYEVLLCIAGIWNRCAYYQARPMAPVTFSSQSAEAAVEG